MAADSDPPPPSGVLVVIPGETIVPDATPFLRGHGTYVNAQGALVASVCGIVERVNKLITVVPLHARYMARSGDVVVGRVVDVKNKQWYVDINGRSHSVLPLNSVNLPYGELRRRKDDDALNMRSLLEEDDLFSAEVMDVRPDGGCNIHTRSLKYGKLANGMLAVVHPALIKRLRQHFVTLEVGVDLILGCNGYVWLTTAGTAQKAYDPAAAEAYDPADAADEAAEGPVPVPVDGEGMEEDEGGDGGGEAAAAKLAEEQEARDLMRDFATKTHNPNNPLAHDAYAAAYLPTPKDKRQVLARVANAIAVLNRAFVAIYPSTVMDVYQASLDLNLSPADMLLPDHRGPLTALAVQRKGRGK